MTQWPGIRRIFRLDRGDAQRGVDDELQFHFQMKVDELQQRGFSPEAARAEAERSFGDVPGTRRTLTTIDRSHERHQQRREWFGNTLQDLRLALRSLRLRPWFAVAVIGTLGLGIGANVTMFRVVDRLFFRPPAFLQRTNEVNRVYLAHTLDGVEHADVELAYLRYLDLVQKSSTIAQAAVVYESRLAIGSGEQGDEAPVEEVSASFWSLFSPHPVLGRFFTAEEDIPPRGSRVAVLGYGYWQSAYAGAHDVVGKHIQIGRNSYTIIGVAPRGFAGMAAQAPAVFLPITAAAYEFLGDTFGIGEIDSYYKDYGWTWLSMVVRRKPGASEQAVSADLTNAYRQSYIAQHVLSPALEPVELARPHALAASLLLERGPNQGSDSKVAIWLVAVAAIVLLIACANVANLLLARAFGRRREVAVRLALGVSRSRLLSQLLTESLTLSLAGGAAGMVIAQWGGAIVQNSLFGDSEMPGWTDTRLLLFALVAAAIAGIAAGIVPALQSMRADITTALKTGVREGGHARSGVRQALLITQASLSVVLLIGAGLFVRSLQQAQHVRLGYDADRVLWASTGMGATPLSLTDRIALKAQMLSAARALPQVESAAHTISVPFRLSFGSDLYITGIDSVSKLGDFQQQRVSGDYFRTMGTAIRRGRAITESEAADSNSHVIVVSESMARVLWPHADALGQCVRVRADTMPCTVVIGIAEDIKTSTLGNDPSLHYYLPIATSGSGGIFIRTRGDAELNAQAIQLALRRTLPASASVRVEPFAKTIRKQTRSWQLGATMFTIFGILALIVAGVGLYSVVAYGVAQRSHEMGVRLALGAQTRELVTLVLREVMRTAAVAVVLGTAVALLAGRWMRPLLFGTSPYNPVILGGVALVLLAVSAIAAAIPARRAARIDPNTALRAG